MADDFLSFSEFLNTHFKNGEQNSSASKSELAGLLSEILPIFLAMSDKLGYTNTKLENVLKGIAQSQVLTASGIKILKQFIDDYKAMNAWSKTSLEISKDSLTVQEQVLKFLTTDDALNEMILGAIERLSSNIEESVNSASETIAYLEDRRKIDEAKERSRIGWLEQQLDRFWKFADYIKYTCNKVLDWFLAADEVFIALALLGSKFTSLIKLLHPIKYLTAFFGVFNNIATFVKGISVKVVEFTTGVIKVGKTITGFIKDTGTAISKTFSNLDKAFNISAKFDNIIKPFTSFKNSAIELISKTFKSFTEFIGNIKKVVSKPFESMGKLFDGAKNLPKLLIDTIKGSKQYSKITEWFNKMLTTANEVYKAFAPLRTHFKTFGKIISKAAKPFMTIFKVGSKFAKGIPVFGELLMVIDGLIAVFRSWHNIWSKDSNIFANLFNVLRTAITGVVNGFLDILTFIPGMNGFAQKSQRTFAAVMGLKYDTETNEYSKVGGPSQYLSNVWNAITSENGSADGPSNSTGNLGAALAKSANSGKRGTGFGASAGKCGLYVGNAVERVIGKDANQLRGNGKDWAKNLNSKTGKKYFSYLGQFGTGQLGKLPEGSILSWPASTSTNGRKHPYGHVEIADGKGNLISDFSRPANSTLYNAQQPGLKAHVFAPKGSVGMQTQSILPPSKKSNVEPATQNESTETALATAATASAETSDDTGIETADESMTFDQLIESLSKQTNYSNDSIGAVNKIADSATSSTNFSNQSVGGVQPSSQSIVVKTDEGGGVPVINDIQLIQQMCAMPIS